MISQAADHVCIVQCTSQFYMKIWVFQKFLQTCKLNLILPHIIMTQLLKILAAKMN